MISAQPRTQAVVDDAPYFTFTASTAKSAAISKLVSPVVRTLPPRPTTADDYVDFWVYGKTDRCGARLTMGLGRPA
jgi:hypothetical protein